MAGIEDGIAAALAYAADDRHGYELRSGNHWPGSYDIGTDCAGLARLYAAAVEGVTLDSYPDFGTWSEVATLTKRGWDDIPFSLSAMRRGDILVRALGDSTGHTVVYLGGSRIVGAENNWDGVRGDGSGAEVTERPYYDYSYNHILRWEGDEVTDADIKNIARAVWDYAINIHGGESKDTQSAAQHLSYVHWDTERTLKYLNNTDDPTGRGMETNMKDHIKWLAAGQAAQNETLAAIVDALGKVTDKLDAVAQTLDGFVPAVEPDEGATD